LYQRKDKKFTWERLFKSVLISIIVLGAGIYIVLMSLLISSKNEFNLFFNGFNVEDSLIEESYIDYNLLNLRAQQIEELIGKYHIPKNMTGEGWDILPPVSVSWHYSKAKFYNSSELLATFNPLNESSPYNNRNNMTYSGDVGHTALYEGVYLSGEAFRYAVAKRNDNETEMNAALNRIEDLVTAYEILSEVSGMGAWCRYAVPYTKNARKFFPASYFTTEDHFNVTYKGFKWVLSRHISRDVYTGCLLGLSMVYALVDDDDIREKVGNIIDRTIQWFYDCKWRIVDVDGTQHTSGDFISGRPLMEGQFILTFLRMGKMVNPDKWTSIYYHYLYDRGLINTLGRTMRNGIDLVSKVYDGYYGCNFIYYSAMTLIFLEEDPNIKEIYIKNWLNVIHDFCKLHRNAYFDVVWLLCHAQLRDKLYEKPKKISLEDYDLKIWKDANIDKPEDKDYIIDFCIRDIKDCLMRYALKRYPNRDYYFSTTPGSFPNKYQRPIPNAKYPKYTYWEADTRVGQLITSALSAGGRNIEDDLILNNSLPVDMRGAEDIMWQRRSFTVRTTEQIHTNPGTFQVPMGPEYLSVYWIAKYLDLF